MSFTLCISSHFKIENCTSLSISKASPSLFLLTKENACSAPRAVMISISPSSSPHRSAFRIPCRSSSAKSEINSAACGFCICIWSKYTCYVRMIELVASKSLLRPIRFWFSKFVRLESLARRISIYFLTAMLFSVINAATWVTVQGKHSRASTSLSESSSTHSRHWSNLERN